MVDTAVTPEKGTPEYDAAMVAKYEATTTFQEETPAEPTKEVPTRPEHIPEKFWDAEKGEVRVEALAKSYAELEKAKGKPLVEESAKKEGEAATTEEAQKAVEAAGVNFQALSEEYATNGQLSDETYKTLEGKGFPKNVVDAYIAGQHALAAQWDNTGYEVAGGQEQFNKMAEWAKSALSQEEKVALNAAMSGPGTTVEQMKLAVAGLRQKYESANGKAPGLIQGGTGGDSQAGYQSRAQMVTDMKDPRYAKDPAFRKQVEAKLALTTSF
jgi:hypothetical protein